MPIGGLLDDRRARQAQCLDLWNEFAVISRTKVAHALLLQEGIDAKEHAARVAPGDEQPAVLGPYQESIVPWGWGKRLIRRQRQLVAQEQVCRSLDRRC